MAPSGAAPHHDIARSVKYEIEITSKIIFSVFLFRIVEKTEIFVLRWRLSAE